MLNKSILMGRLTKDPELRTTPSDVSVVSFSIAVERKYKSNGEKPDVDFIDCVAWRGMAEFIAKHFRKGNLINVVGSLQSRIFEKDGQKRTVHEVVVDEANFTGERTKPEQSENTPSFTGGFSPIDPDDFPR